MEISFTSHIWREDNLFVAHTPELDVSSAGETPEIAKAHLREAVGAFVEEAERMGTLREILEESGFRQEARSWQPRKVISVEEMHLALR